MPFTTLISTADLAGCLGDALAIVDCRYDLKDDEWGYAEYVAAGATFGQKLKKQAWGGRDFIVRDPDGNGISFVGPAV